MSSVSRVARTSLFGILWILNSASLAAPPAPTAAKPAAPSTPAAAETGAVDLTLAASGATEKIGGYNPRKVVMNKGKPAALKKAPEMLSPMYGQIRFGGKNFLVAIDEPATGAPKLYVDANSNGDLTDDPAAEWEEKGEGAKYSGGFQLPLGAGDKAELATFKAYRFDPADPKRAQLKNTLLYYSDYFYDGDVTLGGKKYKAMLIDLAAAGPGGAQKFFIDINGDGQFAQRGEVFDTGKPFNVSGTTWDLTAAVGADGAPIALVRSARKVAEIPLPPNHSLGARITPFKARRMDGKAVNFPEDYKGKIVMLDFWATWCPPCREEIPGLVSAYNAHHAKGFEILGISLDQANQAKQVQAFMKEQGMTWPQVYDGKFWKAAVADRYGINSIPACFLVDGDTGVILAAGGLLRGGNLETTLTGAIDKKLNGKGAAEVAADKVKAEEKPSDEPADKAAETPAAQPETPAAPEPAPQEEKKEALPF